MKKALNIKSGTIGSFIAIFFVLITLNSCVEDKSITEKSGMKLWSENCQRCHNTSSSNTFSAEQWKTIGLHMQGRALLTNMERDKIIEFLQN
jgi:nitrate/TMAO reductase-like tetraheme cytochrome c subunit